MLQRTWSFTAAAPEPSTSEPLLINDQMLHTWVFLFSLLLFRDRELYRSDNRLIPVELSDSEGHGE